MGMAITYWSGETSIVVYLVTCYLSLHNYRKCLKFSWREFATHTRRIIKSAVRYFLELGVLSCSKQSTIHVTRKI